jgi:hypothetical protein
LGDCLFGRIASESKWFFRHKAHFFRRHKSFMNGLPAAAHRAMARATPKPARPDAPGRSGDQYIAIDELGYCDFSEYNYRHNRDMMAI